jgi:hypothetical protein
MQQAPQPRPDDVVIHRWTVGVIDPRIALGVREARFLPVFGTLEAQ